MVRVVGVARHRRRGFTLIELAVAVAVVGILGTVAYASYLSQTANARTGAASEILQQIYTGMMTYNAQSSTGAYSATSPNTSGTAVSTAAGYAALITDLSTTAGIGNLPSTLTKANIATWSYEPINTTSPATFTITATASNGNGHVLCEDPSNGVVDLGSSGTPATAGVSCK